MFDTLDDFDWDDEESDSEQEEDDFTDIDRITKIEDDLIDRKDEITDKEEDIRDYIEDTREELEGMSEMRRELEEIRRMKEDLRREIESVRREKDEHLRRGRRLHDTLQPPPRTACVRAPRPPRPPRRAAVIDFSKLTDDLEDMMEGLGEQLELSLKSIGDIKFPHLRISKTGRRSRSKRKRPKDYENIPPKRIAYVIGPLGSEERLKILNFLKEGGKTFNELETYTGKTGSSLTHHLSPLVDSGYVIKGEVRGTYYVTVEGRLAYRLAQWLTSRLEAERILSDVKEGKLKEHAEDNMVCKNGDISIEVDNGEDDI